MTPERWQQIEALFHQALELDEVRRAQFLDEQCKGDPDLRHEVEQWIAADAKAPAQLQAAVGNAVRSLHSGITPGKRAGPYEILNTIGEGGMGAVYLARRCDDVFRKEVAIKVVKRGMDTDAILRRFSQERRILATLEHPNIARVLDGGSTDDGLPYLVMEYVDGVPLTQYCDGHLPGLHERLRLFQTVCGAVEHAHRNLVVHRDLKPGNILVDSQGQPHLLDFGIAKVLQNADEAAVLTIDNMRLFTPMYASPEQLKGEPAGVASDVFGLGLVLYEMLTGSAARKPRKDAAGGRKPAFDEEIRMPSHAAADRRKSGQTISITPDKLRGDLDRIIMKALETDPHLRYGSVEQFAADISRFLESRPVLARPQTFRYCAQKFARRHGVPLTAGALVFMSLVGGIAYSMYQARRAETRFQQVRRLANTFVFDVHDAIQPLPGSTKARELVVSTGLEYLDSLANEADGDPNLQLELAQAYAKLGNVQGAGRLGTHLGDTVGALSSHRKAINLFESLSESDSTDPKILRDLATSYKVVGDLELDSGKRDAALVAYKRNLEITDRIVDRPDRVPRDLLLYGQALVRIGERQSTEGDRTAALASLRKALDQFRKFAGMSSFEEGQSPVAYGLQSLARAYGEGGEVELAVQTYKEAVTLREGLYTRDQKALRNRRELGAVYYLIGNQLFSSFDFSAGDRKAALDFYSKALMLFEQVKAADPGNARSLLETGLTLVNYGNALSTEDPQTALELTRRAESISRQMAQADPANLDAQRNWANAFYHLAERFRDLRRFPEAAEAAERSLMMIQPVSEKYSDARRDIVHDHRQVGEIRSAMRDLNAARLHFEKAVELASTFQSQFPRDLFLLRDLADSYRSLGRFERDKTMDIAQPASAREASCKQSRAWFQKTLDVWDAWQKTGGAAAYKTAQHDAVKEEMPECR